MNGWNVKNLIFKKDNLISFLTIFIALIIFLLDIFTDYISIKVMFEALIIILTLTAITNIIERETRNQQTDLKIIEIKDQLIKLKEPFFVSTEQLPKIEYFSEGSSELFHVGGTLTAFITLNLNFFDKWLREGRALKFIIQNPTNEGLKYINMPSINYSSTSYIEQIKISIDRLKSLKNIPNANIKIRLSNVSPTQTLSIVDGHVGGKRMYLALHLPNGDAGSRPCFILKKDEHEKWFNLFYDRYYKSLWEQSEEI